ncbi:MAG: 5-aminoimidazole-4-carboxamide ribonucleotide transformylase [Clostridia bacterium]|nr:5-aminoimidazole-4-carboxamide ribonucleotide transformylase [Clostridia bacterium]
MFKLNNYILRYGLNPHQSSAEIIGKTEEFPFKVLNGTPGYINFLDALNSYQLVRELKNATKIPAAASFKHVSPAGAAIGMPLTIQDKAAFLIPTDKEYNSLSSAYLRARHSDPVSAYGDFIALSDIVDLETALLIDKEVSDGIIAPGYDKEALDVLKQKRKSKYIVIQIDADYEPSDIERRDVFGITFSQARNNAIINESVLNNIVTVNKTFPSNAIKDAIISMITLKYTQSNSTCFSYQGQTIGIGAGQQSRIHCTRIAANKAELWMLRHHPRLLDIKYQNEFSRTERYNIIDMCLNYSQLTQYEKTYLSTKIEGIIPYLSEAEKSEWIQNYDDIVYASDAFIPFRDNIDRAAAARAKYIIQTGGSIRDEEIIKAANEYGMTMIFSGLRLFTH